MKILIAPDKFKGSLTAMEVCNAIEDGLRRKHVPFSVEKIPLADGGEGTAELLTHHFKGRMKKVLVADPLGRSIEARYGISHDGTTAFMEMASASGLSLLGEAERNPMKTSTFGTGQLIADALREGVSEIVLGIGGSATNDAGVGMAQALGFIFETPNGIVTVTNGQILSHLTAIRTTHVHNGLKNVKFTVLCDVDNPLYGPTGAAYVYAPQKGASEKEVQLLDEGLFNFARVAGQTFATSVHFPGAGAAGGMGAGARVFLHAQLRKGIDYISELLLLEEKIKQADLIITGEGRLDEQTFSGKVVSHIVKIAATNRKPVVLICGQCSVLPERWPQHVVKILCLANSEAEVPHAMRHTASLLQEKVSQQEWL